MSNPAPINEASTQQRFNLPRVLALVIGLPLIALSQFIAHARTDDIDAWFFLHYGRELLSGATLYADLWDIKPPGIFWLNALGLGLSGGSPVGVWTLCALAAIGAAVLFYRSVRQVYGPTTAAIGTVFAIMYFNLWTIHVGGNRPATFLILTELGCMVLYLRAITQPRASNAQLFWAGACGGLGLWFKQTAFAAPAAIFIHLLIARSGNTPTHSNRWRKVSSFVIGYLSSIALLVAVLALTSDLKWAWDAIVGFNQNFFAPGIAASFVPSLRWMLPHTRGMELMLILAAATLARPIFGFFRRQSNPSDTNQLETPTQPPVLLLFWMWMLIAIYLSAVGPHNRPMYLAVALPPLVMLATHSLSLLMNSTSNQIGNTPPHYIVIGVLWFAFMLWTPLQMQIDFALRQYHWFTRPVDPKVIATVEAIQRYAEPDDAIFLDGYAPELYWRANRRQAIRYLGTEKIDQLKQHGQPLMDETARCLQATNPRVIIFDFKHWHSAGLPNLANVEGLESWVRQNYDQPELDRFPTLWVRRTSRQ
jgi:hypothetical protein